jgi:predicted TIM-barrel fold metal-dependent hydrolase
MLLSDYRPRSCLVTKSTTILKPRFPVVDFHNHLGDEFGGGWIQRPLDELMAVLDEAGVRTYVDFDGMYGESVLEAHLKHLLPGGERFKVFGGVDWSAWQEQGDGFAEWAANRLRIQKEVGAAGVKVWKPFGLHVRDHLGKLVPIDDERLDPLWQMAGELKMPVAVHIADPVAFFEPVDEHNERWEELQGNPDWQFLSPPFPAFLSLVNAMGRVVERHPQTTFIGAHVAWYAENLGWVGDLLDRCPNLYIDIGARIGELGRQPYTARRFFLRYADRILFGTDAGPDLNAYRIHYRFLETDDEYFNYNPGEIPGQGRWMIYGLHLPDEVLEKIYYRNAERVLSQG